MLCQEDASSPCITSYNSWCSWSRHVKILRPGLRHESVWASLTSIYIRVHPKQRACTIMPCIGICSIGQSQQLGLHSSTCQSNSQSIVLLVRVRESDVTHWTCWLEGTGERLQQTKAVGQRLPQRKTSVVGQPCDLRQSSLCVRQH